ncbi:MAG TPA: hypothetical protein VKU41_24490 [Polyangiaceae bacterium]|nr:hypothetical protein [Polyangiaceae bacterium]
MRLALGLSMHTGWAAAAVAGGDFDTPVVVAREHVELLDEDERFVFHKAAEMALGDARAWVEGARSRAIERAAAVMRRLAGAHGLRACAVVAKEGRALALAEVVAAHPRIHAGEGHFYRDVLCEAAEAAGMRAAVISPRALDARDPRLVHVGRVVGKPWSADWKLAVLAAWTVSSQV